MSVQIQLETGYLDVKEGTAFPLNFGVADIRDVSKKSGAFSKTITLTGTANNHNLLNHYYDVNVQAGTFNINKLTRCSVIQNGLPVLESGYLQLIAVKKVQTTSDYENEVEYEVLVKDESSDFFTKLGSKELTDLDFTDLNHEYRAINVVNTFNNTQADGYKYLLPFKSGNEYFLQDMKPAIYAKTYFDRIFSSAGFSYTWDTLTAAHFDKLIIPFNGEKSLISNTDYLVNAETSFSNSGTPAVFINPITGWTETQDAFNLFNPTTGIYDVPFNLQASESIVFEFTFTADLTLINSNAGPAQLQSNNISYKPYFQIDLNGTPYATTSGSPDGIIVPFGTTIPIGNTSIGTLTSTYSILASNVITTDLFAIQGGSLTLDYWTVGGVFAQVGLQIDFTSLKIKILPSSDILGYGAVINMNNSVPNKVKQSDFIKSLFTMYNLYTEQDTEMANNLILKHRDDYYDEGQEVDWTYKLAKDKEQSLQFLPELSAKKLILTYKQDDDDPNKVYFNATKEIYGQVEYTFESQYVKGIDTKEMLFSPTPIGVSDFNAYLPTIGIQPKTNIRILHDCGVGTCDAYNIYNYGNTGEIGITQYPILHHWDDPINPTFDILFAQPDYMFYEGYNITNNNLYNLYWRRTVNQINVGKMLTAYFDLREDDIQRMKLNDKIRIDNSWWTINKVIDYNCNEQMLTQVELMSVDTEIDLAPFKKGSVTPTTVGDLASHTGSLHWENNFAGNVIPATSVSAIYGQGNVIQPNVNGIIVGNNKILDQNGIVTEKITADVASVKSLTLTGAVVYNVTDTGVNYYMTSEDYAVICTPPSAINVYLPFADVVGKVVVIKSTNYNTVLYPTSATIDGSGASITIPPFGSRMLICYASGKWAII